MHENHNIPHGTIDMTGQRIGRLVIIRYAGSDNRRGALWECRCDCGNMAIVRGGHLREGRGTRSCGCFSRENPQRGGTHYLSYSPEYMTWAKMRARCENQNDQGYDRYGARGIRVCNRWRDSFENFYADMGPRPSAHHSIDRIDNNGDYSPENCRWATVKEQARNRRSTRFIEFRGESKSIAEWAEIKGMSYQVLFKRLQSGWPAERALTQPVRARRG